MMTSIKKNGSPNKYVEDYKKSNKKRHSHSCVIQNQTHINQHKYKNHTNMKHLNKKENKSYVMREI